MCAFLLCDNAYSNKIINMLTQNRGILNLMGGDITDWDKFKTMIQESLDDDCYQRIFSLSHQEINVRS